jgi:hypothetical protein
MSRSCDDQVWAAGDVFIKKVSCIHCSCPLGRINCLIYTLCPISGVQSGALLCLGAQMVLSSVVAIYLNSPVMKIGQGLLP